MVHTHNPPGTYNYNLTFLMKASKWLFLTGETLKIALGDPELVF
jgi:hypothetical protein